MKTIKEVFDSKYFQGITSKDEEAYYVCKEQMTNTGNKHAYIWYMLEAQGRLQGIFSRYYRDYEVPFTRIVDAQKFKIFQNSGLFRFWTRGLGRYNTEYGFSKLRTVVRRGVHSKIVQIRPTVKAVSTHQNFNILIFLRENKEASFLYFEYLS